MERPQDKLETAGSAPKKRLIKNKLAITLQTPSKTLSNNIAIT